MYYLKRTKMWVPATYDEITIGIKGVSIDELEKYYRGIHPYDSFYYNASRFLCTVGLEEVTKIGVYKRQIDVDKVFFDAVTASCETFLLEWASDWREVYRQLSVSKVPFRDLIVTGGSYELSSKAYRMLEVEISQMKRFFSLLNMQGAVRMLKYFCEFTLMLCRQLQQELPETYPFALKGKPMNMLPATGSAVHVLVV